MQHLQDHWLVWPSGVEQKKAVPDGTALSLRKSFEPFAPWHLGGCFSLDLLSFVA